MKKVKTGSQILGEFQSNLTITQQNMGRELDLMMRALQTVRETWKDVISEKVEADVKTCASGIQEELLRLERMASAAGRLKEITEKYEGISDNF